MNRTGKKHVSVRLALAGSMVLAAAGAALLGQQGAAAESAPPSPAAGPALLTALVVPAAADPAKVVGAAGRCQNCHATAFAAWEKTPHKETFEKMHNSENAKKIIAALGLEGGIKSNGRCVTCHYTSKMEDGKPKTIAGVSCESCHGAAADWVTRHQDYGGEGVTKDKETDAHRAERWKTCDSLGMIRKDRIYLIAENCFSCHTVPDEDLVNKGGHKPGSDFELVAWSQGMVRHNFKQSESVNAPNTPQQLRMMYIVGKLVELEVTLRNLSTVKDGKGDYFKYMQKRCNDVLKELDAVQAACSTPEVAEALAAVPRHTEGDKAGKLKVASVTELSTLAAASAKVKAAAEKVTPIPDPKNLDSLIPSESSYKGAVFQP